MNKTVTDNIEAERARNHMSINSLCAALEIDRGTYINWRKKGDVPCSAIIKCMEIFKVSADYLLRDVT